MRYVYFIFDHGMNVSHVKGIEKRGWIVFSTTYLILYLVEYMIG